MLQQQKEALERDVREAESAPALAEAARKQGMIPTRDTAHLVQAPDGNWVVVGTPKPADGVPPPPLNAKLPEEGPPAPPTAGGVRRRSRSGCSRHLVTRLIRPSTRRSGPQVLLRAPDGASTLGGSTSAARSARVSYRACPDAGAFSAGAAAGGAGQFACTGATDRFPARRQPLDGTGSGPRTARGPRGSPRSRGRCPRHCRPAANSPCRSPPVPAAVPGIPR